MTKQRYGVGFMMAAVNDGRYDNAGFDKFRRELALSLVVGFDANPNDMVAAVDKAVNAVLAHKPQPVDEDRISPYELREIIDAAVKSVANAADPDRAWVLCEVSGLTLSEPRVFADKTSAQDAMAVEWAKAVNAGIDPDGMAARDQMLDLSMDRWHAGDKSIRFQSMAAWVHAGDESRSWRIFEKRLSDREDARAE